jgi:hypothetical protein
MTAIAIGQVPRTAATAATAQQQKLLLNGLKAKPMAAA